MHFQAPGEAEAELAKLNRKGVIDAVLMEDSDVIVFGADHVLRR
jgi:Holliday junction resolvase YEN1